MYIFSLFNVLRNWVRALLNGGGDGTGGNATFVWQARAHTHVTQMTHMPSLKPLCLLCQNLCWLRHRRLFSEGRKWGVRSVVVGFGVFGAPRFSVQRSQNPLKIGIWGPLDGKSGRPPKTPKIPTTTDLTPHLRPSDHLLSGTGGIRFRGARFQTPSSVSFFGLTEFRGANSVSSSQPIICVPKRTHRVSRRTHRVCRRTQ